MPEEIMVIAIIAIIFGTITVMSIVKTVMRYKYGEQKKASQLDTTTSQSMTTSELKAMLRETVTEATQPLVERIEMLEERYFEEESLPALEASRTEPLLELPEELDDEDQLQRTRSRTR